MRCTTAQPCEIADCSIDRRERNILPRQEARMGEVRCSLGVRVRGSVSLTLPRSAATRRRARPAHQGRGSQGSSVQGNAHFSLGGELPPASRTSLTARSRVAAGSTIKELRDVLIPTIHRASLDPLPINQRRCCLLMPSHPHRTPTQGTSAIAVSRPTRGTKSKSHLFLPWSRRPCTTVG